MTQPESPQRRTFQRAVRSLLRYFKSVLPVPHERRQHRRVQFIYPVTVIRADGRRLQCLTRDLSLEGMRLLGSENLMGQTVRVAVAASDPAQEPWCFSLQVLWSTNVGDGLFDSGGRLLDLAPAPGG
jgi:hypothetical protein